MGALDNLTILRYGHVYEDGGGGMEQYLVDLNRALNERNDFKLIQVQLTSDPERICEFQNDPEADEVSCVSMFVDSKSHEQAVAGGERSLGGRFLSELRNRILLAPGLRNCITEPYLRKRAPHRRSGEPEGAGETVRRIHEKLPLDLICLHSAGGGDAEEILRVAESEGIPIIYVHHFSNDRLDGLSMRNQIDRFDGVAGVTGVGIPRYLRDRFQTVADGIDVKHMSPASVPGEEMRDEEPLLFLPARITPSKGQAEVIRLAVELDRLGFKPRVAFAGRTDDRGFLEHLEGMIAEGGLRGRVSFLGQLGREELLRAYQSATMLVFPTRHHEGLPRILMEGQATGLPVVGYEMGGMKEGVVEATTGFLVPPGDFEGLLDRVVTLLENPQQLAEMALAARRFAVERFGLAALAERHEQFYLNAMRSR